MAESDRAGTNWGDFVLWFSVALIAGVSLGMGIAVADAWVLIEVTRSVVFASVTASCMLLAAIALGITEWSRLQQLLEDPFAAQHKRSSVPVWVASLPVAFVVLTLYSASVMAMVAAPGTGLPKEGTTMRVAAFSVLSTGFTTGLVIATIHIANGLGQRLYTLLRPPSPPPSTRRTVDDDLEQSSPDRRLDGQTVGKRSVGASRETVEVGSSARDIPSQDAAAAALRADRAVRPKPPRPFFAVPVQLMWMSLFLFIAAGFYFGVVFALTKEDDPKRRDLAEDLELTLSVGGGIGAVVGFWSFFVHQTQDLGPDGRTRDELEADEALAARHRLAARKLQGAAAGDVDAASKLS